MGALSDTDAANLLNAKFGATTLSVPASYWLALSSTEPNDDGTGVTEPTGAYARVEAPSDATTFPVTTVRSITNGIDFAYPDPGTGDDWGVCQWWALYDASTAGNMRAWGRFGNSIHVVDGGDGPVVPAGALVINLLGSS